MAEEHGFTISMEQLEDYEFKVKFDWDNVAELTMDEPEPIGTRKGPNASRVLETERPATSNCSTCAGTRQRYGIW